MANYISWKKAWNRIFSHSPWDEPMLPTPWFWTSSLQNCETVHFSCSTHPVCGTLLWQPRQIYTSSLPHQTEICISPRPSCHISMGKLLLVDCLPYNKNCTKYFHHGIIFTPLNKCVKAKWPTCLTRIMVTTSSELSPGLFDSNPLSCAVRLIYWVWAPRPHWPDS